MLAPLDSHVTRWKISFQWRLAMEWYRSWMVQEHLSQKTLVGVANGKK